MVRIPTENTDRDLVTFIESLAALERGIDHVPTFVRAYSGMGDFLHQHGRLWIPARRPAHIKKRRIKMCFQNSFVTCLLHPELRYVEGFATAMIPVHHAWCVDSDGNVVDTTWGDSWGCSYFGVEFPIALVRKQVRDHGSASVFHMNRELMINPFSRTIEMINCLAKGGDKSNGKRSKANRRGPSRRIPGKESGQTDSDIPNG